MAKASSLSKEQEAIAAAQNAAGNRLPDNADARRKLIFDWKVAKGREADAIAKVKEDVGAKDLQGGLIKKNGLEPLALSTIEKAFAMDPLKRARAIRQILIVADDYGWIIKDLFDDGAFGSATEDDGQGSVFDQTTTGKRQGGAKAEPRTVEEMAASKEGPAPTTGLDLSTPEARAAVVAKFEEAAAARKGKRGPKSPEFKELEAAAELAKEAEKSEASKSAEQPEKPPEDKSNVVPFAQQQREANAAGDAMTRGDAPAPAPEKPKRPSRAKGAKKDDAPPPPPSDDDEPTGSEARSDAPPPPPSDDDDDAPGVGATVVGAHQIGDQSSSYVIR